ncbi:MAG TPA: hypothetical protein VGQ83_26300 [Polyangia bacterium]
MLDAWLPAFLLTCVLEVPIYALLRRRLGPPRRHPVRRAALLGLAVNAVTHPCVWFLFPRLGLPYWRGLALAEVWVVVVEGVLLAAALRVPRGRLWVPAGAALLANAVSLGVGLLARYLA